MSVGLTAGGSLPKEPSTPNRACFDMADGATAPSGFDYVRKPAPDAK